MHTQLVLAESWCGADFAGQQGCEADCAIGDPSQKPTGFMRRNTTPRRASPNLIVAFLCISSTIIIPGSPEMQHFCVAVLCGWRSAPRKPRLWLWFLDG